MQVARCQYLIQTKTPKQNGKPLTQEDLIDVGYMAGRFGVNLNGDLTRNIKPRTSDQGTIIDINCCTTDILESTLEEKGIKFNKIA